ncbi:neo-calmodulin-like [Mytilus californianus]|uniref:neo-calmodulin-like n=1 Tax=Mytilus californianus TaxID=6549 RepID=UPI002247E5EE|nr:neo-calmodulin-like [Mytilus californianus]
MTNKMQRFTFQLSIGGSRIMTTKEIKDNPKGLKKADGQEKVTKSDVIKLEEEIIPKEDTKSEGSEKTTEEKITEKNMEQKSDEKIKGITKEVEEQLMKSYKNVSDAYKKLLINFFKAADTENVGYLTIQKFVPAVRKLGYSGTDRTVAQMFVDVNTNFDGKVTIYEFMSEMTKRDPKTISDAELLETFRRFDTNKDGYITKDELETTLDASKIRWTDFLLKDIIKKTDFDGDGKISWEEFQKSCQYKQIIV